MSDELSYAFIIFYAMMLLLIPMVLGVIFANYSGLEGWRWWLMFLCPLSGAYVLSAIYIHMCD